MPFATIRPTASKYGFSFPQIEQYQQSLIGKLLLGSDTKEGWLPTFHRN
jgi:hypothetical protein